MPTLPITTEPTTLQLMERYTSISEELDRIDWTAVRAVYLVELRRAIRRELGRRLAESEARS